MMTADTRAKLDSILATGAMSYACRVLTCAIAVPTQVSGLLYDPPYPAGERLTLPAVPGTPPAYDPDTFDPAVWTDCTALVASYNVRQELGQAAFGQLSVPAEWDQSDVAQAFAEMRVILIQEQYSGHDGAGNGLATAWENKAFLLSDGYGETWDRYHHYEVSGRDVLKLATLNPLGWSSGTAVYQADVVQVGTLSAHQALSYKCDAGDAYEYFLPSRGGYQQPDWADRPAPQLWFYSVPGSTGPVKVAIAGDAVQVVFGEGVLRINKRYCAGDPGADYDYTLGLGLVSYPDIRGVVYRFAHPTMVGYGAEPDVVDAVTVAASGAGYVDVAGNYSAYPGGLTLILHEDASEAAAIGARYPTTGAIVYTGGTGRSRFALADAAAVVPVGAVLQYGDCNRARDVVLRWLLESGFQTTDSDAPFYCHAPEMPHVGGVNRDLLLPPLVYADTDRVTVMGAMEDLRQRAHLPPNYLLRADADGHVSCAPVEQLADGDPGILECGVLLPQISIDRTDREVVTRVVARGQARQVQDITQTYPSGISYAWVTDATGLPAASLTTIVDEQSVLSRLGEDWQAALDDPAAHRLRGRSAKPTTQAAANTFIAQWHGAGLVDITFTAPERIDAIELDLSNSWQRVSQEQNWNILGKADNVRYGDAGKERWYRLPNYRHPNRAQIFEPQEIALHYEDPATGALVPLLSSVLGRYEYPDVQRFEAGDFDTRQPVTTERLRIVCISPSQIQTGSYNDSWWWLGVAVWLTRLRIWRSEEVRGEAALGETAPFDTAGWIAARNRLGTRTYVLPDVAPWAQNETDAGKLALAWLTEFARDLSQRRFSVVRPDLSVGDTAQVTLPGGSAINYLVPSVQHTHDLRTALGATNYGAY